MKITGALVVAALCGSGGFAFGAAPGGEAICDQPWVFYCDNFENHPVGPANFWPAQFKSPSWDLGPNTLHSLTGSQGADGTKALQQTYPAGYNYGAGFGHQPRRPHHDGALDRYGKSDSGSTMNYNQNVGDVTLTPGQWYCVEGHFAQGSNGSGTIEGWINGTRVISYANVPMHNGTPGPAHELQWTGHWNCDGESSAPCPQLPQNYKPEEQYRWIDAVALGTQRIGCLGTPPPPNIMPPAQPKNLRTQ